MMLPVSGKLDSTNYQLMGFQSKFSVFGPEDLEFGKVGVSDIGNDCSRIGHQLISSSDL
jgi:hypothetical protein